MENLQNTEAHYNYEQATHYTQTQLDAIAIANAAANREREQMIKDYLKGLWKQYHLLIMFAVAATMFSGFGLVYHQFTLSKLTSIERKLDNEKYEELQQSIQNLENSDQPGYQETCSSFLGMRRCERKVD